MICITIHNKGYNEILEILSDPEVEMAEIRLDSCKLTQNEIEEIFRNCDLPLVATCRISSLVESLKSEIPEKSDSKIESQAFQICESKLITAIKAGASYADIEIEAPAMMSKRIRREAQEFGTYLIRSYHDFNGTDSAIALKALVEKCFSVGADIVKIAATAISEKDADRVLNLYREFDADKLIAFCMGEMGKNSRIGCLRNGAPFSYASIDDEDCIASGQWPVKEFRKVVYGDFEPAIFGNDATPIEMPCSKSIAQRAIISAALAEGTSLLKGYSPCGDNDSAISVARAIGAEVTIGAAYNDGNIDIDNSILKIKGVGSSMGSFKGNTLHTGESGLLTRIMIPIIGVIASNNVLITGDGTLKNRPLKGAQDMMKAFGISIDGDIRDGEIHIPLSIRGSLKGGNVRISGKEGSQLISGLLAALPLIQENTIIHLTEPKSIPYIFMTIDVLRKFGIIIESEMEGGDEFFETQDWTLCEEIIFHIKGGQKYKANDIDIEADWSSAANFLVAGAIFGEASLKGLDTASLQADLSIMDILAQAGASMSQEEESGIIHIHKAPLTHFEIDAGNCPDLFPIISILAAFCEGKSKIDGISRIATKESNRGKAILEMLTQMGVNAMIKGDRIIIEGHSLCSRKLSGNMLKGGKYSSYHDHRMLMALMVAGLGAETAIEIDDTDCVKKSFPTFIDLFERL